MRTSLSLVDYSFYTFFPFFFQVITISWIGTYVFQCESYLIDSGTQQYYRAPENYEG